ncbi:MAG: DUF1937 family protein [Fuerstiella sp.]|nr:DUF1937 family protein [Fuerstiella sp.]
MVRCDEVVVLTLDGWRNSEGVQAEVRIAAELGKPVRYLEPEATGSPTLAHGVTMNSNFAFLYGWISDSNGRFEARGVTIDSVSRPNWIRGVHRAVLAVFRVENNYPVTWTVISLTTVQVMVIILATIQQQRNAMSDLTIIWDESEGDNAEHIADNFQTFEDVENALEHPFEKDGQPT